jgi:DNA-binding transcriptional LysR family regulator
MTLEQLRIFIVVAELQHVTRAAEKLNLTQSAVSSAIQALESRHRVKLFDRIGRGIELTRAGAWFLIEARNLVLKARNTESILDQFADLKRGFLAVHASQTIANYWLVPYLVRFGLRYPGVEIQMTIANTALVADAVATGQADLGLTEGELDNQDLAEEIVAQDQMVLVFAKGSKWASHSIKTGNDLVGLNWILRERGSGTRSVFEKSLTAMDIDPNKLHVAFEFSSNEAVRTAVETGVGVTVISKRAISSQVKDGSLISSDFLQAARSFKLVSDRRRHLPPVATAFAEIFKDERDDK